MQNKNLEHQNMVIVWPADITFWVFPKFLSDNRAKAFPVDDPVNDFEGVAYCGKFSKPVFAVKKPN